MTLKRPPRFAAWLLLHFGCSADNDAVLGDLVERFREGESPAWYWKQTLIAIVVSTFEDIHTRKLLALRAVLAGCLAQMSIEFFVAHYLPLVPYWVPLSWWGTGFENIVGSVFALLVGVVGGSTIVRLYRGRRAIVVFYLLIMQVLGALTAATSEFNPALYLTANVSLSLGILTGGLWFGSRSRVADLPEGDIQ